MITLGGKKIDAPLEIVQIFWLQLEILHSEQILSKKFDKRLQFRYRSVNKTIQKLYPEGSVAFALTVIVLLIL